VYALPRFEDRIPEEGHKVRAALLSVGGAGYDIVLATLFVWMIGHQNIWGGCKTIWDWFLQKKRRPAAVLAVSIIAALTAGIPFPIWWDVEIYYLVSHC
jgi:hypothetical protein